MSLVSQQIIEDSPQGEFRRIRYSYTDSAGVVHVVGPIKVPLIFDAHTDMLARVPAIEAALVEAEFAVMQQQFYAGQNPLRDSQGNAVNPVHQSRNAMIAKLLQAALVSSDPVEVMKGEAFISNVTDPEMMALLSITQAEVDVIRQKSSEVASIKALVDGYVPPMSAS